MADSPIRWLTRKGQTELPKNLGLNGEQIPQMLAVGQGLSKSFSEGKRMWKFPEGVTRGVCLKDSFGDFLPSLRANHFI